MSRGTRLIIFCFIFFTQRLVSSTMRYYLDLHDSRLEKFGYPFENHQAVMINVSNPLPGDHALQGGSKILMEWYIRNLHTEFLTLAVEDSSLECKSSYLLISEGVATEDGYEAKDGAVEVVQCANITSRVPTLHSDLSDAESWYQSYILENLILIRKNASGGAVDLYRGGGMISRAELVVVKLVCTPQGAQCSSGPGGEVTISVKTEEVWLLDKQCDQFWAINLNDTATIYNPYPEDGDLMQEMLTHITYDPPTDYPRPYLYDYQIIVRRNAQCYRVTHELKQTKTVILELIRLNLPCDLGHMVLEERNSYVFEGKSYDRLDIYHFCGAEGLSLWPGQKCSSNMSELHIYPFFKKRADERWKNVNFTLGLEEVDTVTVSESDIPICYTTHAYQPTRYLLILFLVFGVLILVGLLATIVFCVWKRYKMGLANQQVANYNEIPMQEISS